MINVNAKVGEKIKIKVDFACKLKQKENPCFGKQGSLTQTNKHKNYFLRCPKNRGICQKRQV